MNNAYFPTTPMPPLGIHKLFLWEYNYAYAKRHCNLFVLGGVTSELLAAQLAAAQSQPANAFAMYPYLSLFPTGGFGAYAGLAGLNHGKTFHSTLTQDITSTF